MSLDDLAKRKPPSGPKVLTIDIERLIGIVEVKVWEPRDFKRLNYVHPDSTSPTRGVWKRHPTTLCFAAKWLGSKRVEFHAAWKDRDAMVRRAWELFDEADVIVGYNSKRFDEKHLRTDWLETLGLPEPRPWKSVDLYAVNQRAFAFQSKSLDHMSKHLGFDGKDGHYDSEQAERAFHGSRADQRALRSYNEGDVRATEELFLRLRPYVKGINLGLYVLGDDERRCVNCAGTNLKHVGYTPTALTQYAIYRCEDCETLSRSKHRKHNVEMRPVV